LMALLLRLAVSDVVVPRAMANGDFEPPHPETNNDSAPRKPTSDEQRTLEPSIVAKESSPL
jgi:hypothetical protein